MTRRSEMVILAYFTYASGASLVLPVAASITFWTLGVNTALLALYLVLIRYDPPYLRDWIPLALMLVAYKEMGWLALAGRSGDLEQAWVVWDRRLLNDLGMRAAIESAGPLIPVILELAYTLVYTIGTFSLVTLYRGRHFQLTDQFLFCLLLGTFLSYALFPFFPSEPPRTVFPNEDLPGVQPVFRKFNYWFLGNWGIHTSVFPSAHVSSAFAAAFGLRMVLPAPRWTHRLLFLLATLIAVSTVYGRYHYAVDAAAGLVVAIAAWRVTARVFARGARVF